MSPPLSTLWPYPRQGSNNAVKTLLHSCLSVVIYLRMKFTFCPCSEGPSWLNAALLLCLTSPPLLRIQQQLPAFKYDGSAEDITSWARSSPPHTAVSLTSVDTHCWASSGRIQTGIGARLKCREASLNPEQFCHRFSTSSNSLASTACVSASSGPTEVNCKT